jgi:epoxyqueuosine reductase QueG
MCIGEREKHIPELGFLHPCGLCIKACPVTRTYIKKEKTTIEIKMFLGIHDEKGEVQLRRTSNTDMEAFLMTFGSSRRRE